MTDSFIRFRCPRCTGALKVTKEKVGKEVYCPACYQKLTVPAESEPDRRAVDPSRLYIVDSVPRDVRQMTERFGFLEFRCPVCGTGIAVRESDVGQKKECPDCGTATEITRAWFEKTKRETAELHRKSWTSPTFPPDHPAVPLDSFSDRASDSFPDVSDPRRFPVAPPVISEVYGVKTTEETPEMIDQLGLKVTERENRPKTRSVITDGRFAAYCPLCETMQYVTVGQIGTKVRCSECEQDFVVYKPMELESKAGPTPAVTFEGGSVYGIAQDATALSSVKTSPSDDEKRLILRGNVFVAPSSRNKVPPTKGRTASAPFLGANGNPADNPDLVQVVCSLCGTLMYAPRAEIGRKKRCPDCGTENLIAPMSEEKEITGKRIEPVFTGGYGILKATGNAPWPKSDSSTIKTDSPNTNSPSVSPSPPSSSTLLPPIFTGAGDPALTYRLSEPEPPIDRSPMVKSSSKPIRPDSGKSATPTVSFAADSSPASSLSPFAQEDVPPSKRTPKQKDSVTLDALKNLEKTFQNGPIESLPPDPTLYAGLPSIDTHRKFQTRKGKRLKKRSQTAEKVAKGNLDGLISKVIDGRVVLVPKSPPPHPMTRGLFTPMAHAELWLMGLLPFTLGLTAMGLLYFAVLPIWNSIASEGLSVTPGKSMIIVPLLAVISVVGFLALKNVAAFFFSIFTLLASGRDKVDEWIENDFVDGILFGLWLWGIWAAAVIPWGLLLHFGQSFLGPSPLFGGFEVSTGLSPGEQVLSAVTVFHPAATLLVFPTLLLFPVFFLATLQLDVPFSPISGDLLRSFGSCFGAWFGFYVWTLSLIGIPAYFVCALETGPLQFTLLALLFILGVPLYAVILGRLGWVLEDALRETNAGSR